MERHQSPPAFFLAYYGYILTGGNVVPRLGIEGVVQEEIIIKDYPGICHREASAHGFILPVLGGSKITVHFSLGSVPLRQTGVVGMDQDGPCPAPPSSLKSTAVGEWLTFYPRGYHQ